MIEDKRSYKQGLTSAIACSVWWGIMPIYWQWLKSVDSIVIIYYRIVLVAIACIIAAGFKYSLKEMLEPLKDKKLTIKYILSGILITANWSIYIWAVNADHVIQTCIGYYIEPLVICFMGFVIFKEKLNRYKIIALCFALVGVVAVIIYFHEVPLIAIGVSLTFSLYAAIKKGLNKPPILSLLYETVFLVPFALVVIIYLEVSGKGALAQADSVTTYLLLLLCGAFTALPLTLFANAANKISLFLLGLTEYISPTLSLIISIFYFREPFEPIQLIAFLIIWVGLIIFSYGEKKAFDSSKASE